VLRTHNSLINYYAYQFYSPDVGWTSVASASPSLLSPHRIASASKRYAKGRRISHIDVSSSDSEDPYPYSPTSIEWNDYLSKYVILGDGGSDGLYIGYGESIIGPWEGWQWVLSHNVSGMSCYNQLILPHMNVDGGRVIYFACTFTAMWSESEKTDNATWTTCLFGLNSYQNCAVVVSLYEYNNLIYSVDLSRLFNHKQDVW
jgi:hypothetical protein